MDSTHIFHSAFRIDFKVVQFEGYKNGMLKHRIQIRKRIKYHIMSATHILILGILATPMTNDDDSRNGPGRIFSKTVCLAYGYRSSVR